MLSSLLVPLDGSTLSERALAYATLLADPDASLMLISVIDPIRDLGGYEPAARAGEEHRIHAYLAQVLDVAAEQFRSARYSVHTALRTGDAATEILAYAKETAPALIVLTTHGRTGFLRWVEGSIAQTILRDGSHPILVVRPDMDQIPTPPVIGKIIVPLDGTELAERALPVAHALARQHAVPLETVYVLDRWSAATAGSPSRGGTSAPFQNAAAQSPAPGNTTALVDVPVTTRHLHGEPIIALAEYLGGEPNALVVMTSQRHSEPARYPTDSVAEGLVTRVHNPFLILSTNEAHSQTEPVPAEIETP